MTRQEMFDRVVAGLAAQGFKQSRSDGVFAGLCAYRGDDGRKCAAGHLIPDDKYTPDMEGLTVHEKEVEAVLVGEGVDLGDMTFLREVQLAHDGSGKTPGVMHMDLCRVGIKHGLVLPEVLRSPLPGVA